MTRPTLTLVKSPSTFTGKAMIELPDGTTDYVELKDATAIEIAKWSVEYEMELELMYHLVIAVTFMRGDVVCHNYLANIYENQQYPTLVGEIMVESTSDE